jgi:hypothetical protein
MTTVTQILRRPTVTRAHTIIVSAFATAVINVLAAVVFIVALAPEATRIESHKHYKSTSLYRLSPIPAGADWGRS